jgi:peptidoglycan hydrolase CwlO-like protein
MENLDNLTELEDIEEYRSEKQKEYQLQVNSKQEIEDNIYNLKRKILTLQIAIKELQNEMLPLEQASSKANSNLRALKIDIDRAKDKFWSKKTV